ncbi:YihY/virulence factor BrkB family protein [Neptunicoccus cionae]|uniref:YihY/virulence factor BrkB family protein n=1 Tax=Neptunicoccus cionae TaxID=2035344 RepID=UPI000C77712F|nr:YihY/virulence factor BrkB family protein [Amylibacter cionae]PLS22947.1 YihY/virulence factor BrkB family protein [Amylibacter cionae]
MARGRTAESPDHIPAKGWKDVAFRVKDEIANDRIGLVAAGVAFYGLLALFPAITAVIAISGLLVEPSQIVEQMQSFSGLMPEEVMTIITDQATAVAGSRDGGLGLAAVIGILVAVYSASKGMASLIEGLNVVYDENESRGFIKLKLVTIGLTLLLIAGLIIGLGVTLSVPAILAFANLGTLSSVFATVLPWLVLVAMTMFGLAALYHFAPSRDRPEWQWASPGAIIGCIMWIAASIGFAFYVGNFGSYNESFGTLAGAIVLLMWFWISAYIVLVGAEVNAELEAQTRKDTTVGQDEPMGERDAVKADNLGEAAGK